MIITFCGHSQIVYGDAEYSVLFKLLENEIIKDKNCVFYLGAYGNFDGLCYRVLKVLKQKYATIKIVFITPYIYEGYGKLQDVKYFYDDVIFPSLEKVPKRFAILKRNEWMVDNSDYIVSFIKYSWGGAAKMLDYAKKKRKTYVNIAENKYL